MLGAKGSPWTTAARDSMARNEGDELKAWYFVAQRIKTRLQLVWLLTLSLHKTSQPDTRHSREGGNPGISLKAGCPPTRAWQESTDGLNQKTKAMA